MACSGVGGILGFLSVGRWLLARCPEVVPRGRADGPRPEAERRTPSTLCGSEGALVTTPCGRQAIEAIEAVKALA